MEADDDSSASFFVVFERNDRLIAIFADLKFKSHVGNIGRKLEHEP